MTDRFSPLPLLVGDHFVGAITFERPPDIPFEPETIELLEHVTSVIGPVLEEKRQNDRWIGFKIVESLQQQLTRLFGPGHLVAQADRRALSSICRPAADFRPHHLSR